MSVVALERDADTTITHFAHREEFGQLLAAFFKRLDGHGAEELHVLVRQMGAILDNYLPLPGLLDPALHEILPPLMERLAVYLRDIHQNSSRRDTASALLPVGRMVNWIVKVRGWKATVPHFPSEIHYLPFLVDLMSPPSSASSSRSAATPHHPVLSTDEAWEVRSVLLLWLALLLTVPFNLKALSSDKPSASLSIDATAQKRLFATPPPGLARQATLLVIPLLYRPGKEGAYAAFALARVFSREDAAPGLPGFLDWAGAEIQEGDREGEANFIASLFEFLAVLPTMIKVERLDDIATFTDEVLLPHLRGSRTAASSGLIRKLAIKAKGRWWMAKIGKRDAEEELPEGVEELIGDLMSGLGDKDTIVRYSAAKYLARITDKLPADFQGQIVEATLALFAGTKDEPVVEGQLGTIVDPGGSNAGGAMGFGGAESVRGEARWHGVCLALAELARRGLLGADVMPETVKWVLKALTFDLRRASHSVGSNVRDAAAYLLWSLSRACPAEVFQPFAQDIATALVRTSCFDREVGVRRAASAAFQEGVGRLGVYPEGIDVLGKTDFYSVSVRRIAFTTAAVAVASHRIYREPMREHLHHITLRHWDKHMRMLGARALRELVSLAGRVDREDAVEREIASLSALDSDSVHGALLALCELAVDTKKEDSSRSQIFSALASIRPAMMVTTSAGDVLQAACNVMTATINEEILRTQAAQSQIDHLVQTTVRRREPECQEAVAELYGCMSRLRDPQKDVTRLLSELKSTRAAIRQAAALSLGHLDYTSNTSSVLPVITALRYQMDPTAKADVETRRYALRSLADITIQPLGLEPDSIISTVQVMVDALSDYSTDQRGDIGSWIRIIGLAGLGQILSLPSVREQVPQTLRDIAIGGVIKQSVEKLEPCRNQAYKTMVQLRQAGVTWDGSSALSFEDAASMNIRDIDQLAWFTSATQLLGTRYRSNVMAGLVISIGSSIASVSQNSYKALERALLRDDSLEIAFSDLASLLSTNINVNRVFLPTLSTITQLLSSTPLVEKLEDSDVIASISKIISTASRGAATIKSIERLTLSSKLCIACTSLPSPAIRLKAAEAIEPFLAHRFPRIRAVTAEQLYLKLSEDDVEPDLEEVLLETEWTNEEAPEAAAKAISLLKASLAES